MTKFVLRQGEQTVAAADEDSHGIWAHVRLPVRRVGAFQLPGELLGTGHRGVPVDRDQPPVGLHAL